MSDNPECLHSGVWLPGWACLPCWREDRAKIERLKNYALDLQNKHDETCAAYQSQLLLGKQCEDTQAEIERLRAALSEECDESSRERAGRQAAEAERDRQRSSAEKYYAESERLRGLLDHAELTLDDRAEILAKAAFGQDAKIREAVAEERARLSEWVSHASTECAPGDCVCGRLDARSKP